MQTIKKFFEFISRKSETKTRIAVIVLLMGAFLVAGISVGLMVSENAHSPQKHFHMMQINATKGLMNNTLHECGFRKGADGFSSFYNAMVSIYYIPLERETANVVGLYHFGEFKQMILFNETDNFRTFFRQCIEQKVVINFDI